MSDQPLPDDFDIPPPAEDEAGSEPVPAEEPEVVEVAMIVAASAYQVIDTRDDPDAQEIESAAIATEPPQPPTVESRTVEPLAPVLEAIGQLGGRIDQLQAVVDRELRAESSREKVVDRLHSELQEYKNDFLLKITKPIFIDLIQLHDDLGKMAEAIGDDRTTTLLKDVQQGIEDILYRQGVEPFVIEQETFDPRRQRAVSTTSTDDLGLAKRIAARIRPGFAMGEKVIRPELVSVFALKR